MNAYELYDAAFDKANDYAAPTVEYVTAYADGAFNITISAEVAGLIAEKRRDWMAMVEDGEGNSNEFFHAVEKPLKEIDL